MRRLMLFRHAKATRSSEFADYDRPLDNRGRKGAALVGRYLETNHLSPEMALVSPSLRTRQTWDIIRDYFEKIVPVYDEELYHASSGIILSHIRNAPAKVKSLMVVGHNPGFADLADELAGVGDSSALVHMRTKFPTSAVAIIDFDIDDWKQVRTGEGHLTQFVTPKILGIDG